MNRMYIKRFTCACLMGCTLAFLTACSDEQNTPDAPVFPEKVEAISFTQAGEHELAFSANADWILSSSKIWCKLKMGTDSAQTLTGTAGEQKVTVVADETLWGLEDATADITLTMQGQTKVIATVTRGAKGLTIEGLDRVTVTYNATDMTTTLAICANFDWELTPESLPVWMDVADLPRKGYAGRTYEVPFSVKSDYIPFAQTEGTLNFFQSGTDKKVTVPADYSGMPDDAIRILAPESTGGWHVSEDGKTYSKAEINGEDTEVYAFPLSIYALTKNYDYKMVRFVDSGTGLMDADNSDQWNDYDFFTVNDRGEGHLTLNAPEANIKSTRYGYVLMIPNAIYDSLQTTDDLIDQSDWMDFKQEYKQYIVFQFEQAAEQTGFELTTSQGSTVDCTPASPESELVARISGEFGLTSSQIYQATVPSGTKLTINPMLSADEWNGEDLNTGLLLRNSSFGIEQVDSTWEPGMSADESQYVVSHEMTKTLILIFRGTSDWVNKKALIIEVK